MMESNSLVLANDSRLSASIETARRDMSAGRLQFCSLLVLVIASLAFGLYESALIGTAYVVSAVAVLQIIYGCIVFVCHGGFRLSVLGLFNYSTALFVGFPTLMVESATVGVGEKYLFYAVASAVVCLALINLIVLQVKFNEISFQLEVESRVTLWISGLAVGSLLGLVVFRSAIPGLFTEGAAFIATLALGVASVVHSTASGRVWLTLLAFGGFAVYAELFHGGSGRLRLVAIVVAYFFVLTARASTRGLKYCAIVGTPVALIILAQYRLEHQESLSRGASQGNNGLESLLATMQVFPRIIAALHQGTLDPAGGSSLVTVFFSLVPDDLRPSWLPQALGYELVPLVRPDLWNSGYSTVATVYGEAWWNFGIWGVPLMAIILAALIVLGERLLVATMNNSSNSQNSYGLLWLIMVVAFCGSSLDLVWNGFHGWLNRMVVRFPLWVVFVVATAVSPIGAGDRSAD